ncbi:MAG: RNase adapter RapZ [Bradymonadales bacterium]|jgi:UPF0042 nucleotide-binding protein
MAKGLEKLVLISGMGGSGKSAALHALEDLGYYCMDNVPLVLLPHFLRLLEPRDDIDKVAVCVDVRDRLFLDQAPEAIRGLRAAGYNVELLFLDAADEVLLRRYKETRRAHPLDKNGDILAAIRKEREILAMLAPFTVERIDTGEMTVHMLRAWFMRRYAMLGDKMSVSLVSFGFKHGILLEADLVFDLRFLKNPFFVPELAELSGLDHAVQRYVFSDPDATVFAQQLEAMLTLLLPRYAAEGKLNVTVGLGCTGGRHRSVSMVEQLYRQLAAMDYSFERRHRDLSV